MDGQKFFLLLSKLLGKSERLLIWIYVEVAVAAANCESNVRTHLTGH